MLKKQLLSSKLAIFSLIILLAFFVNLKFKQWQNQRQIEKQMQELQSQAQTLQKKNDELNQSLQYLNSPDFKERVARQQLGLKKEGEQVYSFGQPTATTTDQSSAKKQSNASKWWDYFFDSEDNISEKTF